MKTLLLGISFLTFSLTAMASRPLIVKKNYPGRVRAESNIIETCEVHPSVVILKKMYSNGFEMSKITNINLNGNITKLIEEASKTEVLTNDNGLCDGPQSTITAFTNAQSDLPSEFTLYFTGGCGNSSITRKGLASSILLDVVNSLCPTIHEIPEILIQ